MKVESGPRLVSLDVFRGITIAFMILVNSPGNETAYPSLDHAAWNGLTPTDWVFPFFVFIVGVSLVFSIGRRLERGDSRADILRQVAKRSLIIFALGLVLNGFPYYHVSIIRIPGVLQRIAICYAAASVFFLYANVPVQVAALAILLGGYGWLMTHVGAPGFLAGDLSKEGNLAAFVDRTVFGRHLYRPVYDPEGILSTVPAVATALIGALAGTWLRSAKPPWQKVSGMLSAALVLGLVGWKWSATFPINKALWSSSYVCVTGALALTLLSGCYASVEIMNWRSWSKPFEVFGLNAIAAYFLHVFFLKVQNLWPWPRLDGTMGNFRTSLTDHLFGTWMSPENASLCYAVAYMLLWLAALSWLYRRKTFIRI